tara:strand:+ start:771 stop:2912 length:2142 start_codon:yes stop_codon:yes gene_type:complete
MSQDKTIQITSSPILKCSGIPDFEKITPTQIKTDIPYLLESLEKKFVDLEKELEILLKENKKINWNDVMDPLNEIGEKLRWSWGVVNHLNGVCNTSELREAHSLHLPEIIRFGNRIGQSKILFKTLSLLESSNYDSLDNTQRRILKNEIVSMKNRGVGLDNSTQIDFNKDSEKLAELSTTFSNNVLDATNEWSLLLTKKSEIDGIPLRALEIYASAANEACDKREGKSPTPQEGPWRIGLDMPRYMPFMSHGNDRSIREILYKAFVQRASKGENDNQKLIKEILIIRKRQAKRLGYKNWAELSLSTKMAENIGEIEQLLEELRSAAFSSAKIELDELKDFAKRIEPLENIDIKPWDLAFWSEKLQKEKFDLDQEYLRPWFPLNQVLNGLFKLCERLFKISVEQADGAAPIWHKDVRFFNVRDSDGTKIASFFLDPYSRSTNKRGGAWMDECLGRSPAKDGVTVSIPVAYLICNQTPPSKDKPSLMSFQEVETLFHEFGHGLQHMLTTINYPQAAGINNVEWDAVELPSQFMENWCLEKQTINDIAEHWQTGEKLPDKEYKKLILSKKFNSGLSTLRQVHFALTDLKLHSQWDEACGFTPDQMRREISKTTTIIPPIKEDSFLCAFNHIFAGGYSAGYYSYKWAEVLSADAYSAFEDILKNNNESISDVGLRFRQTILAQGGSRSPQEIYISFRGRPATTEALIRHSGLIKQNQ